MDGVPNSGKERFGIRGHEGFCISDRTGSACVAAKKEKWRIRDVRGNPWTPSCYDGCTRNGNPFPAVAYLTVPLKKFKIRYRILNASYYFYRLYARQNSYDRAALAFTGPVFLSGP